MRKYKTVEVIVDKVLIGYVVYLPQVNNLFGAEVQLNGPICMRLIDEPKETRNTDTIKRFKCSTSAILTSEINLFIMSILKGKKYSIKETE